MRHFIPFAIGLTLTLNSCQQPDLRAELREGDILFQDLQCGPLCEAINAVTQGVDGRSFSHCGMVVRVADTLCVVEAIGGCVQLTSLRQFFARTRLPLPLLLHASQAR